MSRRLVRTGLLFAAAILMLFAAGVNVWIVIPHLRGDLMEINVRPTLVAALETGLAFGAFAMFGFALLVLAAALEARAGVAVSRISLSIIATTYSAFGVEAFAWSGSHHSLGYVLMGGLLGIAAAVPDQRGGAGSK